MVTLAELLGQVPFGQRPMTAGPSMQMNGRDELGNPTMRDVLGQTYMADYSAFEPQQAAPGPMANDPRGLRVPDGPVMPRSGTGASAVPPAFVGNIVSALTQGMTTPAQAARGEPVTMGDVMSTAVDYGIMGAPMSAPEGALRAGGMRTVADDVADMLRQGRGAEVTDEMMAAVDPQEMWRLYESGATGVDMPMDEASRMARAREMGFSPSQAYHATNADFLAFDPDFADSGSSLGTGETAFWTTTKPKTADSYLPGAFVVDTLEGAPLGNGAARYYSQGSQVYPMQVKVDNADWWNMGGGAYPQGGLSSEIAEARAGGSDAVVFQNMKDQGIMGLGSGDRTNTTIATLTPSGLRSRFARFDPRLSHLRNLSASMAGLLGANAVTGENER